MKINQSVSQSARQSIGQYSDSASGQFKQMRMFCKWIIEIGVRIQRSEMTAECDVSIDIEKLLREKQYQVLMQQFADGIDLFRVQFTQIQAFDFGTERSAQSSNR